MVCLDCCRRDVRHKDAVHRATRVPSRVLSAVVRGGAIEGRTRDRDGDAPVHAYTGSRVVWPASGAAAFFN